MCSAAAAPLLYLRLHINGFRTPSFTPSDNSAAFCSTVLCRRLSLSYLFYYNLRLLLLPTHLAHDYSMTTIPNLHDLSDPRTPFVLLFYTLLISLITYCLFALYKKRLSLFLSISVGSSLLILPFLPASNLFVIVGFTIAERVLYLPSAGFCILATRLLAPSPRKQQQSRVVRWMRRLVILLLLVFHSILTMRRNLDWRTNLTLLQSGVDHQPTNSKLLYNIGLVYHQGGEGVLEGMEASEPKERHDEAMVYLREARRLLPTFHEAACVESYALRDLGRAREAEALLRETYKRAEAQRDLPENDASSTETPKITALHLWSGHHAPAVDKQVEKARLQSEASQRTLGIYYTSRALGDLLELDQKRKTEAAAAYLPALQLQPQDKELIQKVIGLVEAGGDANAVAAIRRYLGQPQSQSQPQQQQPQQQQQQQQQHQQQQQQQQVPPPPPPSTQGGSKWGARLAAARKE